jgi:ATP-dependent RNA helicase HrpB
MTPVDAILPELLAALSAGAAAVLAAPPGAGKTTRVAPALINAPWVQNGKIILLSPRRIAARAAAARMSAERGEPVGATIGYRVRLDSKVSRATRIEVVTEGVFTRLILDDPGLAGVAAVLFDEFHERSLDSDLGLALARETQAALRPDLRLLVMSATLDTARVAALLGDAPVIQSQGRMYPVEVRYRPRDARAPLEQEAAAATRAALASDAGDALVFLPGAREIDRTAALLREQIAAPDIDIRPLYGAMSPAEQDAAIAPSPPGRRKIVLATSIAETSLTIEGVRIVIDCGLARRPRHEPALGLTRLETVRASQAAIEQRRGRAGRTAPGVCWRLWSEGETRALAPFDRPEMLDADLSGLALDLALWGSRDPASLAFLDPPPKAAWSEAIGLLVRIGALNAEGAITVHGRALARLPLPPRLAHMVAASQRTGEARLAARLAVLMTEQGLGGREPDLRARLAAFQHARGARDGAARALAERIARLAGADADEELDDERAGVVLARGFPERIAKARGAGGAFLMANGRAASIDLASPLAREPFLVIAETAGAADRGRILAAAPITLAEIEERLGAQIEQVDSVAYDAGAGAVRGRRTRRLGKLVLSEAPLESLPREGVESALLETVRAQGVAVLDWAGGAGQLRARVALMRALDGEVWPDWSDAALAAEIETWLAPALSDVTRMADIKAASALWHSLSYAQQRRLEAEAPERFATPAGGSPLIDYVAEGGPALDVRLQELFGVDAHPAIAGGRVKLSLRLLSPAGRPVQTTQDLPRFWRGSYAEVRAQMRGRYPKHPWPEDPLSAAPTRKAKPRS